MKNTLQTIIAALFFALVGFALTKVFDAGLQEYNLMAGSEWVSGTILFLGVIAASIAGVAAIRGDRSAKGYVAVGVTIALFPLGLSTVMKVLFERQIVVAADTALGFAARFMFHAPLFVALAALCIAVAKAIQPRTSS